MKNRFQIELKGLIQKNNNNLEVYKILKTQK